jgi:hypothetical protein
VIPAISRRWNLPSARSSRYKRTFTRLRVTGTVNRKTNLISANLRKRYLKFIAPLARISCILGQPDIYNLNSEKAERKRDKTRSNRVRGIAQLRQWKTERIVSISIWSCSLYSMLLLLEQFCRVLRLRGWKNKLARSDPNHPSDSAGKFPFGASRVGNLPNGSAPVLCVRANCRSLSSFLIPPSFPPLIPGRRLLCLRNCIHYC